MFGLKSVGKFAVILLLDTSVEADHMKEEPVSTETGITWPPMVKSMITCSSAATVPYAAPRREMPRFLDRVARTLTCLDVLRFVLRVDFYVGAHEDGDRRRAHSATKTRAGLDTIIYTQLYRTRIIQVQTM